MADAVARGGVAGSGLGRLKEGGPFVGLMAELVAEDPQGIVGVTEAAGHLGSGQLLDEEGAEGLVVAVARGLRAEKELGLVGIG